jgi:hypothetical protein
MSTLVVQVVSQASDQPPAISVAPPRMIERRHVGGLRSTAERRARMIAKAVLWRSVVA